MVITSDKRRWLEISAVLLTGFMKYIFMGLLDFRAFYIATACIFWSVYIFLRYRQNKLIMQEWGFRNHNFKQTFLFLLPFSMIMVAVIVWYGTQFNTIFFNWHIIPVFLFYPAWGVIQQFLTAALIAGNLQSIKSIKLGNTQVLLFTSLAFSFIHYPSPLLMIFTFFMELLFLVAYLKWRNLWALGLYHGWVASLLLFLVMGRDLWNELWKIF